jgi:hypothetical protein
VVSTVVRTVVAVVGGAVEGGLVAVADVAVVDGTVVAAVDGTVVGGWVVVVGRVVAGVPEPESFRFPAPQSAIVAANAKMAAATGSAQPHLVFSQARAASRGAAGAVSS